MNTETTIPTNHGPMGITDIMDHLSYVSYRTNREGGIPPEQLAKWYPNAARYEREYLSSKLFNNE